MPRQRSVVFTKPSLKPLAAGAVRTPQPTPVPLSRSTVPGGLSRRQQIDRIVRASVWGNYEGRRLKPGEKQVSAPELGKQMARLNLSPSEVQYIKDASATRGAKATERVERADRHRFVHQDLPALAHAADVVT